MNLFTRGMPTLAPGKEIKIFFDRFPERVQQQLPLTYDVQVTYSDHTGKTYSEPTVLDLSMYVGTGGITRHGLHDVHKQLKVIADNVKRWTDFSGLKVLTRSDLKERDAAYEDMYAERETDPGAEGSDPSS